MGRNPRSAASSSVCTRGGTYLLAHGGGIALAAAGIVAVASLFLLPALHADGRADAFDKDAFRSHKKWYVSFTLRLHGNGSAVKTVAKNEFTSSWKIDREVGGSFELDDSGAGAGSAPRVSRPAPGENLDARFTGWIASRSQSDIACGVHDRIDYRSVTHGEVAGAETRGEGTLEFVGATRSQIAGTKKLKCDLTDRIFDFDFDALQHFESAPFFGAPKQVMLTGEYHDFTPSTKVRNDVKYPLLAEGRFAVPQLTPTLLAQLRSRRLELKDGAIAFTVSEPATDLPSFPSHPGAQFGGRERFNDGTTKGGAPLELSLTVIISPTPPAPVKLLLKPTGPVPYGEWRPLCGKSETVKGNDLPVDWKITEEGGDPSRPAKARKVVFRLLETSKEPGVCMNWPLHPKADPDFDLKFAPPRGNNFATLTGQELTVSAPEAGAGNGTVTVECFDAGANGVLVAEATLEDGRIVKGTVEGTGAERLMIPDFEPGRSRIARGWRTKHAPGKEDNADDETAPEGDGQPGDGFTVYEEYRGFWMDDEWWETDPKVKDLFIQNKLGALAYSGINLFATATQLHVYQRLDPGDVKPDRVMNFNTSGYAHLVDQHCIIVTEGGSAAINSSVCNAALFARFPGPPKNTADVSMLPSMLRDLLPTWQRRNGESYLVAITDACIAHELGHGLGIRHHGSSDKWDTTWTFRESGNGGYEMFEGGSRIFIREERTRRLLLPADLPFGSDKSMRIWVGELHGQHSGEEACIMRYDVARAYRALADRQLLYYYTEREIEGNRLCDSPAGTGVNIPTHEPQSRFGGAFTGHGNCIHKFVVSDRWETKN